MNHWAAVPTGWVTQAARTRGGRLGRAKDLAQKANSNKNFFFFKSIL
jgi:hypothetical protein